MDLQLKKSITKSFSLQGLSIKADALKHLISYTNNEQDRDDSGSSQPLNERILELVDLILTNLDKSTLKGNFVDKETISNSLKELESQSDSGSIEKEAIKVISAFDVPLFHYDQNKKLFVKEEKPEKSLHGNAKSKSELFRRRYQTALQILERHPTFAAPILPNQKKSLDQFTLTPINSLLGNPGMKCVLGTISQIVEGKYYLEDLNSKVQLDLTNATSEYGLITENGIVLVWGEFEDGLFKAASIRPSNTEERQKSLDLLQGLDMFGDRPNDRMMHKLKQYENEVENSIILFSDVWLDNPTVVSHLESVFEKYVHFPPIAVVLMGNFTEHPLIGGTQYKLKTHFDNLASIIIKYPELLIKTKFIFVPGPTDPTGSLLNILPKPAIVDYFTKGFKQRIPNSIFTTNPCRLRYCTQEIVIFRDDIVNRMRRHIIKEPNPGTDLHQSVINTLSSNSHLSCLPLDIRPIYWNYDHSLSLYPLPDLLVLGDKYDTFQYQSDSGLFTFNPSSFPKDYGFCSYDTKSKTVDFFQANRIIEEQENEEEKEKEEKEEEEEEEILEEEIMEEMDETNDQEETNEDIEIKDVEEEEEENDDNDDSN
ncbi:putative DNA polymerase epsilon subunit B [Cavenderia fasciculata]|uniref:DNA polymerase II subunit 2 n=1 Tax=Cavenderia fasciculata TaxID=261658 RepID=F4Q0B5_CACFS|nr:putative DNA polymerase epsilon subunit B [Cavenderia fasciculata]EGG18266.1 putative DNA polymerase epsilon subunit B [Cavenderia fasciculata]|eukprot:XP_004357089.1 putative DNA polymerase epsilon subunit B [Cavenderia fasciculata]